MTLNKTDKKTIKKTIDIIQKEIENVFEKYEEIEQKGFPSLEYYCHQIRMLIECRNRLKNYFILN